MAIGLIDATPERQATDTSTTLGIDTSQDVRTLVAEDTLATLLPSGFGYASNESWSVNIGSISLEEASRVELWIVSPLPHHQDAGLGYMAVFEEDEDGGYVATIPTLPGCVTQGDTIDDAMGHLKDALEGWIEVAQSRGLIIPPPDGPQDHETAKFTSARDQ
jgi:antitoxin HicB